MDVPRAAVLRRGGLGPASRRGAVVAGLMIVNGRRLEGGASVFRVRDFGQQDAGFGLPPISPT